MARNAITLNPHSPPLAEHLLGLLRACLGNSNQRWLVGVSGLQGSGKSTLAAQLVTAAEQTAIPAVTLSLDDFYFGRSARRQLARTHPLFATRGVPGTHDLELLRDTLTALASASPQQPAWIPRFDKGQDTRLPRSRWRRHIQVPQLVLLEGWCVGVPAQAESALRAPVNALERDEDAHGIWRREVNRHLRQEYADLWKSLDALVLLEAPDFDVVKRWRDEQEDALRERHAPRAMSAVELLRFLQHFERLSRHALAALESRATIVISLDPQRKVRGIHAHGARR